MSREAAGQLHMRHAMDAHMKCEWDRAKAATNLKEHDGPALGIRGIKDPDAVERQTPELH